MAWPRHTFLFRSAIFLFYFSGLGGDFSRIYRSLTQKFSQFALVIYLHALHLFQLATLVVRMVLTDRTIKSSNRRPHMSPAQAPHAWRLPSHYRSFFPAAVCAEMLCASLDPCRGSPCRCARDRCARALKPLPGAAQRDCRVDTEFGTRGRPWHGGSGPGGSSHWQTGGF